jgi:hypothetical protein
MKHQSVRDRMDEGEGMVRHDMGKVSHHSPGGIYRNEVEKPELPNMNHISPEENMGYGMRAFKGQADPIALGQAGGPGCKEDESRIHNQFKDYHWD